MPLKLAVLLAGWISLAPAHAAAPDCVAHPEVALDKITARAILVGELHGNVQTPAFVGQLVCGLLKLGRPVILALERGGGEQQALNRYLGSDGQPADVQALLAAGTWSRQDVQDGRNSQAMLALIEQLRQWRRAGQNVGVLAMDMDWSPVAPKVEPGTHQLPAADSDRIGEMRDRTMADKVWVQLVSDSAYSVVALAGNMHTALGSNSRAETEKAPSFADVLASRMPVHVIGLGSHGGRSWNMTEQGTGANPVARGPLFLTDSRIDSRVDLGELTASPPAVQAR